MSDGSWVTLSIDGKPLRALRGGTLLDVARSAGCDIPGLCWHPRITPTGSCRLCIVKIAGRRGYVTACSTPVEEGMDVTAFDGELEDARRETLRELASTVASGGGGGRRDELGELCRRYGLPESGPPGTPARRPVDDSSPVLDFESDRCILCFRCVKACGEIQGKGVIGVLGRGLDARISAGRGVWGESECDGCGECVQLCPTGALAGKPAAIPSSMATGTGPEGQDREVATVCPYCGVGCRMTLHIRDGRIGRVTGIEGGSPNDGRLCVKGRFGCGFVHSPERLTVPLLRKGGTLVPVDWDTALDEAARGFTRIRERYGSRALAGYSSAKCTNEENYLFQKLVRVAFGTNNLDYCTRLCHASTVTIDIASQVTQELGLPSVYQVRLCRASTVTAMLRSLGDGAGTNPVEDYARTGCILVTGANMTETHPVTATYIRAGVARGARLIVVDPRKTALAAEADVWLRPRLGTDVALLNGMTAFALAEGLVDRDFVERRVAGGMHALRELGRSLAAWTPARVRAITGVPETSLAQATRIFAGAASAIVATGMGMSQQTVGTDNVFALLNLVLATGQIGKDASGIDPPRGQNNVQGATDVGVSPFFLPGYIPVADEGARRRLSALWGRPGEDLPPERGLTTIEIMHAAGGGAVRGLYVMGENPLHTDPNLAHVRRSVDSLELLVVQDIFMTETAGRAHIVLPAASFAEKDGTFTNSDRRIQRVRPALVPPGEARTDSRILQELALRMGRSIGPGAAGLPYASAAEIFDEIARAAPMMAGVSHARLETAGIRWPCPDADHPGTDTLFLDRFNTPDGLARFHPVEYRPQSEPADAEYPLLLNSGRSLYQYHSSTMSMRSPGLSSFRPESWMLLHPADAASAGLVDGDRVRVISRRGELETTVRTDPGVAEGEPFMPFHYPDAPVNVLTRDEMDPDSRIAPFKLTACRLERIGGSRPTLSP